MGKMYLNGVVYGGQFTGALSATEEILMDTPTTLDMWATPLLVPVDLSDYIGFGFEIQIQSNYDRSVPYFQTSKQIELADGSATSKYLIIPKIADTNNNISHNPVYIHYTNGNINVRVITGQAVIIQRITGLRKEIQRHKYSTTEQVIGTWIDGKTLYEKTISLAIVNNTGAVVATYPHGIANVDAVHNVQVSPTSVNKPRPDNSVYEITVYANSTNITVNTGADRHTSTLIITSQYTKTS